MTVGTGYLKPARTRAAFPDETQMAMRAGEDGRPVLLIPFITSCFVPLRERPSANCPVLR
jgi:hypothetical protein